MTRAIHRVDQPRAGPRTRPRAPPAGTWTPSCDDPRAGRCREPDRTLLGQTVVVLGGTPGIARDRPGVLARPGGRIHPAARLEITLDGLPGPVHHVVVTAGDPRDAVAAEPGGARERRAVEVAPVRVDLVGGALVDRPLSARLLGTALLRGNDLRATLPIACVVRPSDVAELAVHLMADSAITGATHDLDGGPTHPPGR